MSVKFVCSNYLWLHCAKSVIFFCCFGAILIRLLSLNLRFNWLLLIIVHWVLNSVDIRWDFIHNEIDHILISWNSSLINILISLKVNIVLLRFRQLDNLSCLTYVLNYFINCLALFKNIFWKVYFYIILKVHGHFFLKILLRNILSNLYIPFFIKICQIAL